MRGRGEEELKTFVKMFVGLLCLKKEMRRMTTPPGRIRRWKNGRKNEVASIFCTSSNYLTAKNAKNSLQQSAYSSQSTSRIQGSAFRIHPSSLIPHPSS